jgi:hypothetical protein
MPPLDNPISHEALARAIARFVRNIARDVSVQCHEGVVVLGGSVASATEARALEDLVRWHDGVTGVQSLLEVRPRAEAALEPSGKEQGDQLR